MLSTILDLSVCNSPEVIYIYIYTYIVILSNSFGNKKTLYASILQLSAQDELKIKGALQAVHLEERRMRVEERVEHLEKMEGCLKDKAVKLKETAIRAKQLAAQMMLMSKQLDKLANTAINVLK